MRFAICVPTDPCTIDAADLEVAAVAGMLLTEGKYALRGRGDAAGAEIPAFPIEGHDAWYRATFGRSFAATVELVLSERNEALALALEAVETEGAAPAGAGDVARRARCLARAVRCYRDTANGAARATPPAEAG